jgi:hypothetical protein
MALVLRGGSAVIWSQHQDAFPYIKGMLVIFLSWVCSPIASGNVAASDDHLQLIFPLLPPATACRTAPWLVAFLVSPSDPFYACDLGRYRLLRPVHLHPLHHPALTHRLQARLLGERQCTSAELCCTLCCDFTQSESACSMSGESRQVPEWHHSNAHVSKS